MPLDLQDGKSKEREKNYNKKRKNGRRPYRSAAKEPRRRRRRGEPRDVWRLRTRETPSAEGRRRPIDAAGEKKKIS